MYIPIEIIIFPTVVGYSHVTVNQKKNRWLGLGIMQITPSIRIIIGYIEREWLTELGGNCLGHYGGRGAKF